MTSTNQPVFLRLTIRSLDDDNQVFFSNEDETVQAIEVIPGQGEIFAKLDAMLPTMNIGDKESLTLSKEEAFGDYIEDAVKKVPVDNLSEELRQPGTRVSTQIEDGHTIEGVVVSVEDEFAVIDFNHPLAGKNIQVDFVIVEK